MAQRSVMLDALATYRVTRLITQDEITRPVREKLVERFESRGYSRAAYLLQCPYCVSVWVGLGVAVASRSRRWETLRLALAASGVVSIIHSVEAALE